MIPSLPTEPRLEPLKNTAWWLYIFHSIDLVVALGLLSWIPLIVSYITRPQTAGTFIYSHHTWQIKSFWLYFGLAALGWLLFASIIGIPLACLVWAVAWIWKAYRMIKGILALNRNQPIPA